MEEAKLILQLLFYGVMIFLLIRFIIFACKEQRKINKIRKQDKANGIKKFFAIAHVEGLGVVENAHCSVILSPSNLVISCTGKEYSLPLGRITYVDFIVDANKIRYLQNNMARGIAGAALFGVSGAVIGSAPKSKVEHEAIGYAVIGYRDAQGKEKVVILKDQSPNSYICSKLVKALNSCIHTTVEKVEL